MSSYDSYRTMTSSCHDSVIGMFNRLFDYDICCVGVIRCLCDIHKSNITQASF